MNDHTGHSGSDLQRNPDSPANQQALTDPVCQMDVEPATAAGSYEFKGTTYYFCCESCLERFRSSPEEFLTPSKPAPQAPAAAAGADYTCPMDPEVHQSKPGACPKCGMALEPATLSAPLTKTQYVCPMHPEVVQDEPGA
ncbi:MAG TPA: heavy metal-binding domain-containing protein, partial [Terriglobia bacterium]|nr:heavy metal-binding domain-containing protein [Terriglobia bacterium]